MAVLRIQTLLIRIPDPDSHFDTDPDPVFQFDTDPHLTVKTDPDPFGFEQVMYLKQYFYTSCLIFLVSGVQQDQNKRHTGTLLNFPSQLI